MSARHVSRSVVLQTLFILDSSEWLNEPRQALGEQLRETSGSDVPYAEQLLNTVLAKRVEVDELITKAAPQWPLEKIATTDRNILRIGLCELLFSETLGVPPKVAINEAIELAKEYGGESSSKFVNGVLGTIYKELGEPRKDEGSKHKSKPLRRETLAGAVVYAKQEDGIYLAFVHDVFGHWTLSKGRIEEGEDPEAGAVREIKEEMGLDINIKEELGDNEYIANDPNSGPTSKRVVYYLAEAPFSEIVRGPSKGLDDARWFKLQDVVNLNIYEDILPIVTSAVSRLAHIV